MFKGVAFALGACCIWGLIFVIPQFIEGFSFIEIVLGRYFFYGFISAFFLLKAKLKRSFSFPLSIWARAFLFSFLTTIGYYTCVVLSLHYTTPAICALVLGISPISIAFYGNWKQRECSFKTLIFPSCLILLGLFVINAPHFKESVSPSIYIEGLALGFMALIAWTYYAVANAHFLKLHKEMASSDWATILGFTTLLLVAFVGIFCAIFFKEQLPIQKYLTITPALTTFLIATATLGLLCSWVGTFFWNKASLYLPISLAGQLVIFETIFGLIFICLLDKRIPPKMECFGIALLLGAIVYGIHKFHQSSQKPT